MISITQETIGGESVWLLLAEPNWKNRVSLSISYETEIEESRGNVESRRPMRQAPLFSISYRILVGETDLNTFRNFLGNLTTERIAVPLWPEDSASGYASLFSGQTQVGFDEGPTNIAIATGGATPAGARALPLIIGRMAKPSIQAIDPDTAEITIKLEEESGWEHRIDITNDGGGSFDVTPNWIRTPEESTENNFELDGLGDGRRKSVDGQGLKTWKQKGNYTLDRANLNGVLQEFKEAKGRYQPVEIASFTQAGAATPQAPQYFGGSSEGYMRFAKDTLKLKFTDLNLVETTIEFEQILDQAQTRNPEGYLFEIYSEADPSDISRLTSNESQVTTGGQNYTPARIELLKYKSSLKIQNDQAEVKVDISDCPQFAPILRDETETPIHCKVMLADLSTSPATTTTLIEGAGKRWELHKQELKFLIKPFDGILERNIPRFNFSRNCNHSVFDGACSRVNPGTMARANYTVTGTFDRQWNGTWIRIRTLGAIPGHLATNPNGWFNGGYIAIGTGYNRQVRSVQESSYLSGGDGWNDAYGATPILHLRLDRPIRTDVTAYGTTASTTAGCDGTFETCKAKFSNEEAFGGAPFAPTFILTEAANIPGGGK